MEKHRATHEFSYNTIVRKQQYICEPHMTFKKCITP